MNTNLCYLEDRVLGVLFGTFIGDAIGAKYDGLSSDEIAPLDFQSVLEQVPRSYTDDTQMSISVFEEMLENGAINPTTLGKRFLQRYSPWRSYGGGMLEVIELWKNGENFETAAGALYDGVGSYGDGAAMRISPISCFFSLEETNLMFSEVRKCSRLTHTHALGIDGAIIQAYATLLALNNIPSDNWIKLFFELPVDSGFKIKFSLIQQCLDHRATANEIVEKIGNGSDALSAVPAALYSVLRNNGSMLDAVLFAVELGGDTDTIGAMAGAISGAKFGSKAIPVELMNLLENEKEGRDFILSMVGNIG
jgi:ADP-ribosylglycohydrolase